MRIVGWLVCLLVVGASGAMAKPHRDMAGMLMRIEPDTRLEQACDLEAIRRIGRVRPFKPDRAKSDVVSPPVHAGDTMRAPGAAFRSHGHWYAFSFECRGTPDHTRVLSLTFEIGAAIAPARWAGLGLWP